MSCEIAVTMTTSEVRWSGQTTLVGTIADTEGGKIGKIAKNSVRQFTHLRSHKMSEKEKDKERNYVAEAQNWEARVKGELDSARVSATA